MTFTWDSEKDAVNRRKHAVGFREAATVLQDPQSTTYPDPEHSRGEQRYVTIGRSRLGRTLVVGHTDRGDTIGSSALGQLRAGSGGFMKKGRRSRATDLLPEYDFASLKGGVRGKYAARLKKGCNIVVLEPDVASAFPTEVAANEALRAVLKAGQAAGRRRPIRPIQRTADGPGRR